MKKIVFIILFMASICFGTYKPFVEDQKTAFGELAVAEHTPVVQIQFPYNINADIIESRENNLGGIAQADRETVPYHCYRWHPCWPTERYHVSPPCLDRW